MAAVRKTLLEIVQNIMSELSMDNVNQIQDSSEAMQVANIVQDAFEDALTTRHWPHLFKMLVLTSTDNTTLRPTHLKLPQAIQEAGEIWYNTRLDGSAETADNYEPVEYLLPNVFLNKVRTYKTSKEEVQLATLHSGINIPILNNAMPTAWTSFDDTWIVFNAWDKTVDSTVHAAKTWCRGVIMPEFIQADDFVMDMPPDAQRQIIADAKSRASLSLKKEANPKMEQVYKRNETWLSRKAWRAAGGIKYPDFGRKGKRSVSKSPYIDKNPYNPEN